MSGTGEEVPVLEDDNREQCVQSTDHLEQLLGVVRSCCIEPGRHPIAIENLPQVVSGRIPGITHDADDLLVREVDSRPIAQRLLNVGIEPLFR